MTHPQTDSAPPLVQFPAPRWWVSDRDGRVVVAQPPNAAIGVWLATVLARWTGMFDDAATLQAVGRGALVVWGVDELLRGASPVRRILGAVVLVWQVLALFG